MSARLTEIAARDGTPLHVRDWGERETTRCLLIIHGFAEHGGRHAHVAEFFCKRGWRVLVPDLRGFGRSGGTSSHVRSFDQYIDDLQHITKSVEVDLSTMDVLGHSLGGLITIRFAQATAGTHLSPRAIALSSPCVRERLEHPWWKHLGAWVLSRTFPRTRFRVEIAAEDCTRSKRAAAELADDPLIRHHATAGWYRALRTAQRRAWGERNRLDLPIYLLQSGDDRIVDADASREFANAFSAPHQTFELVPHCYHELLNEPEWRSIAGRLADWLEAVNGDR